MSFFDRIFGKVKSKEKSPIQIIEEKLNVKFPKRFVDIVNIANGKEINLILADEEYKVLTEINSVNVGNDTFESVVVVSNEMNSISSLQNQKIKIPFARNQSGDQYKYIYFESEINGIAEEYIYIMDLDSNIGPIEITSIIDLFDIASKSQNEKGLTIDCRIKSTAKLFEKFELTKPISYWDKSFGISDRNNEKYPDGISMQQHAINYEFENKDENMAKFEMHSTFAKGDKLVFTSSSYEIDNPFLKSSIEYNVCLLYTSDAADE